MASAEPLVRGGQSPPEAESILVIGCPTEPANLAPVREKYVLFSGVVANIYLAERMASAIL